MKKILTVETASFKNRRVKLTDGFQSEWFDFPRDRDLKELRYGQRYEFEFGRGLLEKKFKVTGFTEIQKLDAEQDQ